MLYCDLVLNGVQAWSGVPCLLGTPINSRAYLGFIGDLLFIDTQGTSDPDYTGLGTRYFLVYVPVDGSSNTVVPLTMEPAQQVSITLGLQDCLLSFYDRDTLTSPTDRAAFVQSISSRGYQSPTVVIGPPGNQGRPGIPGAPGAPGHITTWSSSGVVPPGGTLSVTHDADAVGNRLVAAGKTLYPVSSIGGTPFANVSYVTRPPTLAFDGHAPGINDDGWVNNGGGTGQLGYQLVASVIVISYSINAYLLNGSTGRTPKTWTFEGSNDGITYTVLDTRLSETAWGTSEVRTYSIATPGSYLYYRINITANNGESYTGVGQMALLGASTIGILPLICEGEAGVGVSAYFGDAAGNNQSTMTTFRNKYTSPQNLIVKVSLG